MVRLQRHGACKAGTNARTQLVMHAGCRAIIWCCCDHPHSCYRTVSRTQELLLPAGRAAWAGAMQRRQQQGSRRPQQGSRRPQHHRQPAGSWSSVAAAAGADSPPRSSTANASNSSSSGSSAAKKGLLPPALQSAAALLLAEPGHVDEEAQQALLDVQKPPFDGFTDLWELNRDLGCVLHVLARAASSSCCAAQRLVLADAAQLHVRRMLCPAHRGLPAAALPLCRRCTGNPAHTATSFCLAVCSRLPRCCACWRAWPRSSRTV